MPKRLRLTRRPNIAISEDAWRKLKSFSAQAGLDEGEAITFLFENFDAVTDRPALTDQIRRFNSDLEARKA